MQSPNRSREEIVAIILNAVAETPERPTYVMYKANTSYQQLRSYLHLLQSRKLITRTAGREWIITTRGREYLEAYDQIRRLLGKEEMEKGPLGEAEA